jgi:hypothetical protein
MGKGSCYCGKVSFTFAGEPINKVRKERRRRKKRKRRKKEKKRKRN